MCRGSACLARLGGLARLDEMKMPEVWIPARMQAITGGHKTVRVAGGSVRQIINNLETEYPGIRERLCD